MSLGCRSFYLHSYLRVPCPMCSQPLAEIPSWSAGLHFLPTPFTLEIIEVRLQWHVCSVYLSSCPCSLWRLSLPRCSPALLSVATLFARVLTIASHCEHSLHSQRLGFHTGPGQVHTRAIAGEVTPGRTFLPWKLASFRPLLTSRLVSLMVEAVSGSGALWQVSLEPGSGTGKMGSGWLISYRFPCSSQVEYWTFSLFVSDMFVCISVWAPAPLHTHRATASFLLLSRVSPRNLRKWPFYFLACLLSASPSLKERLSVLDSLVSCFLQSILCCLE